VLAQEDFFFWFLKQGKKRMKGDGFNRFFFVL
jgi:hypothetical protein